MSGGHISHDGKGNYFCPQCASSWKAERKRLWWSIRLRCLDRPRPRIPFSWHLAEAYGEGPERRRYVQYIRSLWVFILILGDGYQPKVAWHAGMGCWWPVEWLKKAKLWEEESRQ